MSGSDGHTTFQKLALKSIVKGFEIASQEQACTFTCGGKVELLPGTRILVRPQSTDQGACRERPVTFPGDDPYRSASKYSKTRFLGLPFQLFLKGPHDEQSS